MKKLHSLILSTLTLATPGIQAHSQELSHIQYTVRDGLPGSIVYQCLQDNDGFMWFATNQGVSRFDGKTFKNFTKENGLPDNEILKLYQDSYGDIWFISLQGIPSVLYKGTILQIAGCTDVYDITEDFITGSILLLSNYSQDHIRHIGYYRSSNTPGHWSFRPSMRTFGTEKDKERVSLLRASSSDKINFYFSYGLAGTYTLDIQGRNGIVRHPFPRDPYLPYLPFDKKYFYTLAADNRSLLFMTDTLYLGDTGGVHRILCLSELGLRRIEVSDMYCENDSTLWICSRSRGLIRIGNFRSGSRTIQSYFPEAFCTSIRKDREGGYWVTTHGDGVYYLPDLDFRCLTGNGGTAGKDVKCILATGHHTLVAGLSDGHILQVNSTGSTVKTFPRWDRANKNNRILSIMPYGANQLVVSSDYGLYLLTMNGNNRKIASPISIKDAFCLKEPAEGPAGAPAIVFATAEGLFTLKTSGGKENYLFSERSTCVGGIGNSYYWGTMKGLYGSQGKTVRYWGGAAPALSGIINHIDAAPDSTVWVSTQQGIVVLRNGRTFSIGTRQGLPGDICKNVSVDGHTAWVSTNKGIARISFHWEQNGLDYTTSTITENDGLISNDVNQTAVSDGYLWAATARGISFFPVHFTPHSMQNPLINAGAVISGKGDVPDADTVMVDYKNNKLVIRLSGISFRSGGQITYLYRLRDLDSRWTRTNNNLLEFSTLPFGSHTFEARVEDRWGTMGSQVRRMTILVPPPFWRTWWFTVCTYLFTAILMGIAVYSVLRWRHREKDRELKLMSKMADLEMKALRSQMNPHFIFNCLSSIQYYILNADVKNANLYLHKFSSLIRKTLQHSTNSYTPLTEELSMLGLYMELEQLRLTDRMEYVIDVQEDLHPAAILIPSLIIQPFVENAVKHGISPLQGKKGMVRVDFSRKDKHLVCTIEDNGVGINTSRLESTGRLGEHHSLGLDIIGHRIKIINTIRREKMSLKMADKSEGGGGEQGTIVQICFPL